MSQPQKVSSAIIRAYTQAVQTLQLDEENHRLHKINEVVQGRPKPIKKNKLPPKTDNAEKMRSIDDHCLKNDAFFAERIKVENQFIDNKNTFLSKGLTKAEADRRNKEFGDNKLSEAVKTHWIIKLIEEWIAPFSLLLWAGGALCFIAFGLDQADPSNLYLGIVLCVVVAITGFASFMQNAKSESVMDGFKNFTPQQCNIIRDGIQNTINASGLVVGDVVMVKEGDKCPADLRLFVAKDMRVDNSSLTGESDPLLRKISQEEQKNVLEAKNVAFFGTLVKTGSGVGVVFAIGDNTIIGRIAGLAQKKTTGKTPLRSELDRFIVYVAIIAITLGIIFFSTGFALRYTAIQNLVFAIGIIVANVPEGLLATVTITLTVASQKLKVKKVLVKNLESVETLGSTSCICSDKTGTLTQNKMTVENIFYNGKSYKGDNKEKKGPEFKYEYNVNDPSFQAFQLCGVIGSTTVFTEKMDDFHNKKISDLKKNDSSYDQKKQHIEEEWKAVLAKMPYHERPTQGDASETAIIKFFQPIEDIMKTRSRFRPALNIDNSEAKVDFNSEHKFVMKIYEIEGDDNCFYTAYMKGAPERVWEKCNKILVDGNEVPLTQEHIERILYWNEEYAKGGQRVLGFTQMRMPKNKYPKGHRFDVKGPRDMGLGEKDFTFVGLISLIDPPRDSVPSAIAMCKTAGIKVIMVTGDQQVTASAIAKSIGIFDGPSSLDLALSKGITMDQAIEDSENIVVNGDMLASAAAEDEGLPEKEQGKKLEKWLKKPRIVFARTSPAQKLYIVRGCQRLGYIVAVTGDGVNDSPAIKQGDIGIAMGIAGTDVTKDAADMILLNDDFSAIVTGIKEGRRIFDNLKKSIIYCLVSNIPELVPFLTFIVIQIPLPLSTVLVLCVDLGTDMFPAISFAYEECELDIMTRLPRFKNEHMVTSQLLVHAYIQMGVIQTCGGYAAYYMVMIDFGFRADQLIGIILKPYYPHKLSDVYDPHDNFFGNTNLKCENGRLQTIDLGPQHVQASEGGKALDWLFSLDVQQDVRLGFLTSDSACKVSQSISYGKCLVGQISIFSQRPVCFSTESLKYAQTAFFFAVVLMQVSNGLCAKTRKLSVSTHGLMQNSFKLFSIMTTFVLCLCLAYIFPIMRGLNTRDLIIEHFMWPAAPWVVLLLVYDESRKALIRGFPKYGQKTNWFERNMLW